MDQAMKGINLAPQGWRSPNIEQVKRELREREEVENIEASAKLSTLTNEISEMLEMFPGILDDPYDLLQERGKYKKYEYYKNTINMQKQMIEKRDKDIESILKDCLVPNRYLKAEKKQIHPKVWNLIESNPSVFIYGGAGTGKSHLAIAWLRETIMSHEYKISCFVRDSGNTELLISKLEFNKIPFFISIPDLLLSIRGTFNKESEDTEEGIIDRMTTERPIILDDLGVEKTSEWSLQTLYTIIDRRYRDESPTIITSNLSIQDVGDKLGDRIASRIAGMCKVIELKGKDRRLT